MTLTKEQKAVIMKILMNRVESGNFGMFAKVKAVTYREHDILKNAHLCIIGDDITYKSKPIYRVKHRYASTKRDGMYKELTPTLVAYPQENEVKEETK